MGTVHMHIVVCVSPEVLTQNVTAFLCLYAAAKASASRLRTVFSFSGLTVFSNIFNRSYLHQSAECIFA